MADHARRTTQDVDLVIDVDDAALDRLLSDLPEDDWYVDAETARSAVLFRRQFNVIDMQSAWKADMIVRKARPFSNTEFERRMRADLGSGSIWVATPEDVVISKLEWARKSGGSTRQLGDVMGILGARGATLDYEYIQHWVKTLHLDDLWHAARSPSPA